MQIGACNMALDQPSPQVDQYYSVAVSHIEYTRLRPAAELMSTAWRDWPRLIDQRGEQVQYMRPTSWAGWSCGRCFGSGIWRGRFPRHTLLILDVVRV